MINHDITVLRLGHRPLRDKRISTHLLLAARAFGAKNALYTGIKDKSLEKSIEKIVTDWGGEFSIVYVDGWKKIVKSWNGKVIHLTMYGLLLQDVIKEIRIEPSPKLVVVGGAKVPSELYKAANWNVAVTGQPHSEVSALALFLHELYDGTELGINYQGARLRITPQPNGKLVETKHNYVKYLSYQMYNIDRRFNGPDDR